MCLIRNYFFTQCALLRGHEDVGEVTHRATSGIYIFVVENVGTVTQGSETLIRRLLRPWEESELCFTENL